MRVGILTSGGDCQALNATMAGLARTLYKNVKDVEIIGFIDGYKGLMNGNYKIMEPSDFEGISNLGGTILGSSRCPFKMMRVIEDGFDKVEAMKNTYKKLKLDSLAVLGGNGSIKSANMLSEEGLNVIGLPKTIDNDTWGTDYTFGYQSAINIATNYLDQINTTANSHHRVFVVEIMGHKVGHICLSAGIAADCPIILLPEIPYDIKNITKVIKRRQKAGVNYTVIACSEGALSVDEAKLTKKEYKKVVAKRKGLSVVYGIADELAKQIDGEIRTAVCGHVQRGGNPCPYDRKISALFGIEGARLIMDQDFGKFVVLNGEKITSIKLEDTAGKLKYVDVKGKTVKNAKLLGISFGDE
ncbi:MAG: ATP-dependent 6-phosphofructokinase [Thomasclavelia sp.]|jgi:6-phosphofructokinase|nr:ATP-dependent 6-phosphofructokinase [Thomasclavelia sp.]